MAILVTGWKALALGCRQGSIGILPVECAATAWKPMVQMQAGTLWYNAWLEACSAMQAATYAIER
jgi:hypothetical protein